MPIKYVRFNYFEPQLVPADQLLRAELMEDNEDVDNLRDIPHYRWDMAPMLDYLMTNHEFTTDFALGDEYAEIEPRSYRYDERGDTYDFQLSKLRESNIPSKKRFHTIKEDILLDQDEFIGEFVSILYDNHLGAVALQSNLYGLSVKQTEIFLTNVRADFLAAIGEEEGDTLMHVKLAPLVDTLQLERAAQADYYKKIRIKGSDVMGTALLTGDNLLSEASEMLDRVNGVNFDITLSLGRVERTASLDNDAVRQVVEMFEELPVRAKPKIEITAMQNEEAQTETINLLEPRMTDRISVNVAPRTTIAHEHLTDEFREQAFNHRRNDIMRVLRPVQG
ncbi:DUF6731 family protein [Terribacillus saccharophilus]|uniref:DUF6731 family protein n=1 Tax=Terribacillus saccharophilus TaxID=361277 RepID=UPI000C9B90ED|nr:DUF6731 family protein [Terribacillus goriensis]